MNINFELYKIFYVVGQLGSVTKAAQYLNVSQPAVTKQIKNLENLLEVTLIAKTPKGIKLTEDGEYLYKMLEDSISKLLNIEPNYNLKNKEYIFRITAGNSILQIFLKEKIINFNKKYPNVKFVIDTAGYQVAMEKLLKGESDIVFVNKKNDFKTFDNCIINKCYDTEDIFVVSSEIKDNFPSSIKIKDINNYPIISIRTPTPANEKINEILKLNNDTFRPKYEVTQVNMIIDYIKSNLGIGLVTKECAKEELENKKFSIIEHDIDFPNREIYYATRKNSIGNKYLQEFIKEIKS